MSCTKRSKFPIDHQLFDSNCSAEFPKQKYHHLKGHERGCKEFGKPLSKEVQENVLLFLRELWPFCLVSSTSSIYAHEDENIYLHWFLQFFMWSGQSALLFTFPDMLIEQLAAFFLQLLQTINSDCQLSDRQYRLKQLNEICDDLFLSNVFHNSNMIASIKQHFLTLEMIRTIMKTKEEIWKKSDLRAALVTISRFLERGSPLHQQVQKEGLIEFYQKVMQWHSDEKKYLIIGLFHCGL